MLLVCIAVQQYSSRQLNHVLRQSNLKAYLITATFCACVSACLWLWRTRKTTDVVSLALLTVLNKIPGSNDMIHAVIYIGYNNTSTRVLLAPGRLRKGRETAGAVQQLSNSRGTGWKWNTPSITYFSTRTSCDVTYFRQVDAIIYDMILLLYIQQVVSWQYSSGTRADDPAIFFLPKRKTKKQKERHDGRSHWLIGTEWRERECRVYNDTLTAVHRSSRPRHHNLVNCCL